MKIDKAIEKRRVIEISLFNKKVFYSGVCLKASKKIWIIINYDFITQRFDGYSVFRSQDIEHYIVYPKKVIKAKNNITTFIIPNSKINKVKTFYSAFKQFSHFQLFAFFDEASIDSYFVGKVIKISKKKVKFKLLRKSAKWGNKMVESLDSILYFSFGTTYEENLLAKLGKSLP
jgi:hypothetical protein